MRDTSEWFGKVRTFLGGTLYTDFTDDSKFEEAVDDIQSCQL